MKRLFTTPIIWIFNFIKDSSVFHLLIGTLLILLIWWGYLTCSTWLPSNILDFLLANIPAELQNEQKPLEFGTFGDYFGALNCLFAGLAYVAVFVSIRQQSKSINIQQKELKAQLTEMANSVKVAKAQHELQREYQFSDEFYRRINLLKMIEKDISYKNETGQSASMSAAIELNRMTKYVLQEDYQAFRSYISSKDGNVIYSLKKSMDSFAVWMQTYTDTLEWLHAHTQEIENRKIDEIDINANPDEQIQHIKDTMCKERKHFESILISSTIWSLQYLLVLELDRTKSLNRIHSLFDHPSFASGNIGSNARNASYRRVFHKLLHINEENNLEQQLGEIHEYATGSFL